MNHRIRELMLEADIEFDVSSDHYGIDTAVVIPYDLQKFAELIVKKCGQIAIHCDAGCGDLREGISQQIKQHFGVSE